MGHPGYKWAINIEGGQWRWRVLDRDQGTVMSEGLADSRAEAAAWLARTMTLGVLDTFKDGAVA